MDLPAACMVSELVAAYPDARFVLTTRPVDQWLRSMNATVFPVMRWRSWQVLRPFDASFVAPWWAYKQVMLHGWGRGGFGPENMTRTFREHAELVGKVVPKSRLLEFEVAEGWGPLCRFLGVGVSGGEAFPHVNDAEAYVKSFRRARDRVVFRVVMRGLVLLIPLAAMFWAWYGTLLEVVVG